MAAHHLLYQSRSDLLQHCEKQVRRSEVDRLALALMAPGSIQQEKLLERSSFSHLVSFSAQTEAQMVLPKKNSCRLRGSILRQRREQLKHSFLMPETTCRQAHYVVFASQAARTAASQERTKCVCSEE